jgi:hypothetical protein|tara:strand:- start:443 stop:1885 length:1443 start_codon:yes stop_codon:yes gene_type:complete
LKDLNQIINCLTKDEIRFYKLFVNRTNSTSKGIRKDVELFDLLRKNKSDKYSTKDILIKLKISNSNNYYQLKNRIYNDLNNSLTWQHISKDNQSQSFSYILLSRIFKNKGELNISFNYLLKAEKTAIEKELFEMLSIVYSEIIELSHELILIDIDKYISLKKYNINLLREIDQIDMLLAKIMFDIKTKQNFSKSDPTLVTLINDKIKETKNNKFIINSPRFKMRLFKMYSRVLLQNKEYGALEDYLLLSWKEFNEQNFFNRSNHDEKLTLLTYLTNCLHQNNNYKKSLFYAEELKLAMKEFDAYLEDKYLFYYYNSLVLNYSIDNKNKSLEILKIASKNDVIQKMPAYTSFIYLNTSIIYFQQEKFKLSKKNLSRLILQKDFLYLDKAIQFHILIFEILVLINLKDFQAAKEKNQQLLSNFKKIIAAPEYKMDQDFLLIIAKILSKEECQDTVKFFLSKHISNDSSLINYNDFLKKYFNL